MTGMRMLALKYSFFEATKWQRRILSVPYDLRSKCFRWSLHLWRPQNSLQQLQPLVFTFHNVKVQSSTFCLKVVQLLQRRSIKVDKPQKSFQKRSWNLNGQWPKRCPMQFIDLTGTVKICFSCLQFTWFCMFVMMVTTPAQDRYIRVWHLRDWFATLIASMGRRCHAVITAHGGHTRYWLFTYSRHQCDRITCVSLTLTLVLFAVYSADMTLLSHFLHYVDLTFAHFH